ncbi:MAG: TlpA family protein disulfide reductase [Gemmatimonadaceae bacterium]
MANNLTGDFDVVIQFSVAAVNRALAAMHQLERFPHSISARVEDNHQPGVMPDRPTLVGAVDASGEAISNQQRIGRPLPISGALATSASAVLLDPVVNINVAGLEIATLVPSRFQGRAQLQVFPPTIQIADSSGTKISITLFMLVRYFPDPGTSRAAEFIRGELQLTAGVNQVASQSGNVIEIDIKAQNVGVRFTPLWSSNPLTAEDIAGIELFIRNSLKTSFLPSNSTLPPTIKKVQFKTLSGGGGAVAMLLDLGETTGNPASANSLFLGAQDQFAFGVSADFAKAAFQPTLDNLLSRPIPPQVVPIDLFLTTIHPTYVITLYTAKLEFESGWMVLTLTGYAHTSRRAAPDFNWTIRQELGLAPNGATASLTIGDASIDTDSLIANQFKGRILAGFAPVRDGALADSGANETVADMFDAYRQLGAFLDSLLKPARKRWYNDRGYDLAYASVDISPSGITLHGSFSLSNWNASHVEYEQIPIDNTSHGGFGAAVGVYDAPDYSALRSWIPGGRIQRFEWKNYGETQPGFSDENRFVLIHSPQSVSEGSTGGGGGGSGGAAGALAGIDVTNISVATTGEFDHSTLCLTLHGTRLSPSGPVVDQPVTATICGYRAFPLPGDFAFGEDGIPPAIALARRGPNGLVEVTGHTEAMADRTGSSAPNVIVHFADGTRADAPGVLSQALKASKRNDAPTAIIVVASRDRVAQMRYVNGVTYAEEDGDAWAKRYGVNASRGPATVVVAPDGKIVWKHEGELDGASLSAAFEKTLVARTPVRPALLRTGTRTGQQAPNFLFEYAPGHQITFSKLAGRPAVLLFLRPSSTPMVDVLRDIKASARGTKGEPPLVLAIVDGKNGRGAKSLPDFGSSVTVVPDPDRQIANAYGVTVWPTTLFVDVRGVVTSSSHGNSAMESAK